MHNGQDKHRVRASTNYHFPHRAVCGLVCKKGATLLVHEGGERKVYSFRLQNFKKGLENLEWEKNKANFLVCRSNDTSV